MPAQYSRADVVFNTGRVGPSWLRSSRGDMINWAWHERTHHQPYRAEVFPLLPRLIEVALKSGAYGACLSGGGSAVLALVPGILTRLAGRAAPDNNRGCNGRTLASA